MRGFQVGEVMLDLDNPDYMGYLVLNEDGAVLASAGDLENSERVANIVIGLVSIADNILPDEEGYKKISVHYSGFSYVICLSNKKIYVIKKRIPHAPPPTSGELDPGTVIA